MPTDPPERPEDDQGSVLGTIGTLAFVLSWPLLILLGLGAGYLLLRFLLG